MITNALMFLLGLAVFASLAWAAPRRADGERTRNTNQDEESVPSNPGEE